MKARCTSKSLVLTLDRDEAVRLEWVLGRLAGIPARELPWYDEIADTLEGPDGLLRHTTISKAVDDAGLPYTLDLPAHV